MTLAVEKWDGAIWLVAYDHPHAETCQLLAKFANAETASIYARAHNQAMAFAREVGRSGLG